MMSTSMKSFLCVALLAVIIAQIAHTETTPEDEWNEADAVSNVEDRMDAASPDSPATRAVSAARGDSFAAVGARRRRRRFRECQMTEWSSWSHENRNADGTTSRSSNEWENACEYRYRWGKTWHPTVQDTNCFTSVARTKTSPANCESTSTDGLHADCTPPVDSEQCRIPACTSSPEYCSAAGGDCSDCRCPGTTATTCQERNQKTYSAHMERQSKSLTAHGYNMQATNSERNQKLRL